ncbi:MAG: hypothetical protein ACYCOU_04935, partial [Sulfobacillus sp.]
AAQVNAFAFGFIGRAFYSLYAFIYYLNTPLMGYLLGIGTNAAARLHWVQMPHAASAWTGFGIWARESGWGVHLVDLGLFLGFGYILFRLWFTISLGRQVWKNVKVGREPLSLLLYGFSGELVLMGQITIQGTVNGFTWIFLGLTLAACKSGSKYS